MFFFKKKNESVESNLIGGVDKKILDKIKKTPRKNDIAFSMLLNNMLRKDRILEALNKGLDVNEVAIYNPILFSVEDQETLDIFSYLGANLDIKSYDISQLYVYKFSAFMFEKYWDSIKPFVLKYDYRSDITSLENLDIFIFLKSKKVNIDKLVVVSNYNLSKNIYNIIFQYIRHGYENDRKLAFDFIEKINPDIKSLVKSSFLDTEVLMPIKYLYFLRIFSVAKKQEIDNMVFRFDEIFGKLDYNQTFNDDLNLYFLVAFILKEDQYKYVQFLINQNVNPKQTNSHGKSFYDLVMKSPKGLKRVVDALNSVPTEKPQKAVKDESTTNSNLKTYFVHKKRMYDPNKYDGVFFLNLIQNDIIYFHEEDIIYANGNHLVHKAWFNQTQIINYPNLINDGKSIEKQLIDFCHYIESNPKLKIDSTKIGKDLLAHLYGENLTGILTLNLFADHFLKISQPNVNDKSKFMLLVEGRFSSCIPNYKEYLNEFVQTVINYNPNIEGEITVLDMSFANYDIGAPKRKKRQTVKVSIEDTTSFDDQIIKSLIQKDYLKFIKLTSKIKLNKLKIANNMSLLHLACILNLTDFAIYLLDNGIDVNITTTANLTGSDELIKVANIAGVTALQLAVQEKNEFLVEALINSGADVNIGNQFNQTPLMKAAQKNNVNIVKLLLDYGAKINERNVDGSTALSQAEDNSSKEVYEELLKHGAVK